MYEANPARSFVARGKVATAFGLGADEANGITVVADGSFTVIGSSVTSQGREARSRNSDLRAITPMARSIRSSALMVG